MDLIFSFWGITIPHRRRVVSKVSFNGAPRQSESERNERRSWRRHIERPAALYAPGGPRWAQLTLKLSF